MRAERVVWLDSASHDGWHNPKEQIYRPVKCETLGFVVAEDEVSISLAATFESADQVAQVMTIPKSVIQSRNALNRSDQQVLSN